MVTDEPLSSLRRGGTSAAALPRGEYNTYTHARACETVDGGGGSGVGKRRTARPPARTPTRQASKQAGWQAGRQAGRQPASQPARHATPRHATPRTAASSRSRGSLRRHTRFSIEGPVDDTQTTTNAAAAASVLYTYGGARANVSPLPLPPYRPPLTHTHRSARAPLVAPTIITGRARPSHIIIIVVVVIGCTCVQSDFRSAGSRENVGSVFVFTHLPVSTSSF